MNGYYNYTGTQLLTMTVEMKEHVKSQFLKVEEEIIIPNRQLFPSTITLDGFYWAFGMIRSRAFSRLSGQLAMLPLVDFVRGLICLFIDFRYCFGDGEVEYLFP